MKNIPKIIYLQIDDENIEDFKELIETTWCTDKINKDDLEYIHISQLSLQNLEAIQSYLIEHGANDEKVNDEILILKGLKVRQKS